LSTSNPLLPKEAIALVQHIELNRAGWWDKTVHRLVLAAIWLAGGNADSASISKSLEESFRLKLNAKKLTSILSSLESRNMLLRLGSDAYRIPDEQRATLEREIAASESAEAAAKAAFQKLAEELVELEQNTLWATFVQNFLGPLIKQVGANAYRLVAGEALTADKALVDRWLDSFPSNTHSKLRDLVTAFLDPKKPEVRAYVSRLLHAQFCVEASGLSEDVLARLNASVGKQIRFHVFVDTNFLFSLLDLHENPSNAAAQELRELLSHLKGNPRIDLVITPDTIEEAKSSIASTKWRLTGLPPGRNFSEAALQGGVSGMAIRFLTERLARGGTLTAEDWFDPYLTNFVPIARGRGVELFNQKLDGYSTRQDVIDDIHDVFEFEKRLPESRRKSYPKVEHDMVLWHFVNDKRPAYIESPVDAAYWILTVDFRFIGFDEYKQRQSKSRIPLCIHPTSLIQLLQFWVPRTQEFEEAMLGSLRLPFLFQEFDVEGEKTSLKILKGIGRFEGSETLSQETITHVMFNDGLRARLGTENSEEAEIALIRDALLEEIRLRAKYEADNARALREELQRRDDSIVGLTEQKRVVDAQIVRVKSEKEAAEEAARAELASRTAELSAVKDRLAVAEKGRAMWTYFILLVIVGAASAAGAWWSGRFVPQLVSLIGICAVRALIGVVLFIVGHLALEVVVCRREPMSSLWPVRQVTRFRKWLWTLVILGFVLGVVGNLVANRIQQSLDNQKAQAPTPSAPAPRE